MGQLGGDGRLDRQDPDRVGDPGGGRASHVHGADALDAHPVHRHGHDLPIGRHQPVAVGVESHGRAHHGGLLPKERGMDTEAALALERDRALVESAREHHPAQPRQELLLGHGLDTCDPSLRRIQSSTFQGCIG